MSEARVATTPVELQDALQAGALDIEVQGELSGMPMVRLPPGVRLRGGTLRFGAKGVRLTSDNVLEDVTVLTEPGEVAILNDTTVADLGTSPCATSQPSGRCCCWRLTAFATDMSRSRH